MFFVEQPSHIETVVKLVRKTPDAYIDLKVDMDELDLTASEAKATYQEIKDYIVKKHGVKVSSLYIAQIKQKHGIIERDCYNKSKAEEAKVPQCTPEKEKLIEEALRYFKNDSIKMSYEFTKRENCYARMVKNYVLELVGGISV